MPVNYVVQAQVVDLRTDAPKPTDRFFVDTNVWFWTVYSNVRFATKPPQVYQVTDYPAYLRGVLSAGGGLFWSGLSFSELAHRIEVTEHDIYAHTAPLPVPKPKEYRHNLPTERQRVMLEVEAAWSDVVALGKPLPNPVLIDAAATTAALQQLKAQPLDGYDVFALNTAIGSGINQILTDDGDFCVVPGITLFTANRTVLAAARTQGKLIGR